MKKLPCIAIAIWVFAAHKASAQVPGAGLAANYPAKTVRIIVGFAPGGGIDIVARICAQKFTESLGQSFIVENRPGASGIIAADLVAKANPDGYTLLMTADVHTISPSLFSKLPFDSVKDFTAIGTVASGPQSITVNPNMSVRSLSELIASAKANSGKIAYASAGSGTLTHIAMELFRSMAGIKLVHVPYKGSGASVLAVLGDEVPVLPIALGQALPHAKTGKLRMLAVTTAERTELALDIPTVAEAASLPGYEAVSWQGLLAPAGTPAAIINKLSSEITRQLQLRDVREQLAARAWVPNPRAPGAFASLIKSDIVKWGKVVRESGIKMD